MKLRASWDNMHWQENMTLLQAQNEKNKTQEEKERREIKHPLLIAFGCLLGFPALLFFLYYGAYLLSTH